MYRPPSPLLSHNGFNEAPFTPIFDSHSVDGKSQRGFYGGSQKFTSSLDSNRMDDEHRLIARYAARLAIQNQPVVVNKKKITKISSLIINSYHM